MTDANDGGLSRVRVARMERLCAAAERLGEIAIAPSPYWCESICAAIATGMSTSGGMAAALAITGKIDGAGRVVESELTGVCVDGAKRGAGGKKDDASRDPLAGEAMTHELRARLRGVRSLGVCVDGRWPMVVPVECPTAPATSLAGLAAGTTAGKSARHEGRNGAARCAALALWDVGQRQIAVVLRGGEPGEAAEMLWVLMPSIARRAAMALGANMLHRRQWLSPLEYRVMEMLSTGHDVPSIARKLARSRHTIHDHVKSLHRKMGINSRAELVARALGRLPSVLGTDESRQQRVTFDPKAQGLPASTDSVVD
ncbi:MAG: helix-turn-helix transcriptional regulator [Phycisphaerales bacterium]